VDVPVPRLAAQAHDVEPFGGQLVADRLPDLVDEPLQAQVLVDREVAGDPLPVGPWGGDQGVPEQGVVAGQEGGGVVAGPVGRVRVGHRFAPLAGWILR
jgi:hypothetical protein